MTHVLVVEDGESQSSTLSHVLRDERFDVSVASSGDDAIARFEAAGADLILLDTSAPAISGNEVCRQIRRSSNVPIIMVSSRDDEIDKVLGLEIGADDYVTKPYGPRELVARVRAVLRRCWGRFDLPAAIMNGGPVTMDLERHVVTVSGRPTRLALREFQLLEILLRNKGRVLTRKVLLDRVWGMDYVGDGKTLDVHVKRLREKIEPARSRPPRHIVTVRGLGYRFEP